LTRTRAVVGTKGVSPMVKLVEDPDRVAVMMAEPVVVTVAADTGKVAEVESTGTVTEAGTVNMPLLSDKETTAPPVGAALLRVTVQVAEALEVSEAGLQVRPEGTAFVTKPMEKVTEEPDRVAVMMAVLSAVMVEAVAEKVAEVAPAATVTEAGTVNMPLLSDKETTAPPVGAALLRVTVQVAEALEVSEAGLQVRPEGTAFVTKPMEKVTEEPDRVAVMMAVLSAVMVEAVAEKVAEVAPAATVTEAGTVSAALLSDRVTAAPPVGAALLRVTVQVAEVLDVSEAGLQVRPEGTAFVSRLNEKVAVEPEREAVMIALPSVVMVEAVAEKVAEVAPAATVTDAGTVNAALLSDRVTTAPPDGAAPLRLTVQVDVPEPEMLLGLQLSPDRVVVVGGIVTVPVVPRDVMKSPAEEEAKLLLTSTVLVRLVLVDSVRVALATMPFGIAVEFAPASRHVTVPDTELQ